MIHVLAVPEKNTKNAAGVNQYNKKRADALFLIFDNFVNIENRNHRKGDIRGKFA